MGTCFCSLRCHPERSPPRRTKSKALRLFFSRAAAGRLFSELEESPATCTKCSTLRDLHPAKCSRNLSQNPIKCSRILSRIVEWWPRELPETGKNGRSEFHISWEKVACNFIVRALTCAQPAFTAPKRTYWHYFCAILLAVRIIRALQTLPALAPCGLAPKQPPGPRSGQKMVAPGASRGYKRSHQPTGTTVHH
jgi:hypothetical protein